jgi:hypothetical protein
MTLEQLFNVLSIRTEIKLTVTVITDWCYQGHMSGLTGTMLYAKLKNEQVGFIYPDFDNKMVIVMLDSYECKRLN